MIELAIAIAAIPIAGVAGWVIVERGKQRADPGLTRRIDDLASAVVELRDELDQLASRQDSDRQLLEERLDSAERLLTRARGD
jgi:outer membrane murein-binding lipoprotein Lpp